MRFCGVETEKYGKKCAAIRKKTKKGAAAPFFMQSGRIFIQPPSVILTKQTKYTIIKNWKGEKYRLFHGGIIRINGTPNYRNRRNGDFIRFVFGYGNGVFVREQNQNQKYDRARQEKREARL